MGCLCSKRPESSEVNLSIIRSSTWNVIHKNNPIINPTTSSSSSSSTSILPISSSKKKKIIKDKASLSLLISPKPEQLKLHAWLRKRGHLVRSWKKRYFVLASNSLQYYQSAIASPPYGEKLCGEVYLRGAVMEVRKGYKEKLTIIEITGRKGEKDLIIQLSPQIDNEWINALEWTIRRCSKNYVERVLRSNQVAPIMQSQEDGSLDYFDDGTKSNKCEEWIRTELKKYNDGLKNLLIKRHVPLHVYQYTGDMMIELCEVSIWTNMMSMDDDMMASGGSSQVSGKDSSVINIPLPISTMSPKSYGIKYWLMQSLSKRDTEPEMRILKVSDILNIKVYDTNMDGTEVATEIGSTAKSATGKAITTTITTGSHKLSVSSTCSDYACRKVRTKIFAIDTCHGYALDFICCCQHDHHDLFHSLRNILLYLRLNVPNDESMNRAEEVDQRVKTLSCYSAKIKADK